MKFTLCIILVSIAFQSCRITKSKFIFDKVLWTTDWSPDDKFIAVGGNINKLKLLSPDNLSIDREIDKPNTITKLKWHPNSNLLAVSRQGNDESRTNDNKAEIIDLANDRITKLDVGGARGLGWNSSGSLLAVGTGDGTLSIYNKEGDLIKKIQTEQKAIIGLSWHPTENRIATVGSHLEIIEMESENRTKILPREIEILMLCIEWHPSGEFFVTGDYGDNTQGYPPLLIFWNAEGEKIQEINGSKAEYRNLKWTSDGNLLATASDKIRTWSKDGKLVKERNLGSLLWGIDWSADDSKLVATSEDGKIFVLTENLKKIIELK